MSDQTQLPRGIRNQNPCNIRHSAAFEWRGEGDPDPEGFCTFGSAVLGLRAALILFHNYQELYKLNTLEELISRWAPAIENDVTAYIRYVAADLAISPLSPVSVATIALPLLAAVVSYENGQNPYSLSIYAQAKQLAFSER